MARFSGGVDDIFTASTPNQREIIRPQNQPYPGQVAAAPVDQTYTGSVSSSALPPAAPVSRSALPPVSSASAAPALAPATVHKPVQMASAQIETPRETLNAPPPRQPAMATTESDPAGWSRAGGTQVTIKDGETVYNLSRRFGVPANVIMKVNGLNEADGLKAGQKVVIPTYVYSSKAPVSAPDNNPKVAAAKSSRGNNEVPAGEKLGEKVAVLPSSPKLKDATPATTQTADGKQASASGAYKVQEGDTLSKIARKFGVTAASLKQANGLEDGAIRIGQTLKVPAGGDAPAVAAATPKAAPVVAGATPPVKAKAEQVASYTPPKKADKTIEQAEEDNSPAPDATGIGKMRWPVRGRVIASYGKGGGKSSDGIDIAVPEGTSVKAAENGVVIYAGDGLKDFGNTVLVRHENGLVTVYGNASSLKVARGDKVKRGQEIAVSGMSGNADSPKLHFEVRKNSAPVDPSTFLE